MALLVAGWRQSQRSSAPVQHLPANVGVGARRGHPERVAWGTARAKVSSQQRRRVEAGCKLAGLDSTDDELIAVATAELRNAGVPYFSAGGTTLGALRYGSTRINWRGKDMGALDLDIDVIAYFPTDDARSQFFRSLHARFEHDDEFECLPCCGSTSAPAECSSVHWRGKTSLESYGHGEHQTSMPHRTKEGQPFYDREAIYYTNLHHFGESIVEEGTFC